MNPFAKPFIWRRLVTLTVAGVLTAVVILLILLWLGNGPLAPPAQAQAGTGVIRVAPTGADTPGCGSAASPCATVQYAVDQAQPGDEIPVAAGVYTDVQGRSAPPGYNGPPTIFQAVYLSKTVTVRGGYSADFGDWDPDTYPTTLDAQGQGRVMFIVGEISPTIEGLRLTGGDATGLIGSPDGWGNAAGGGGVHIYAATATISGCEIISNTANTDDWGGHGGGLYLYESAATLQGNTITNNVAGRDDGGHGGGIWLWSSPATLKDNIVQNNVASTADWGEGGGIHLSDSDATLQGNRIVNNTASTANIGIGGGLYLGGNATLVGNTVQGNTAGAAGRGHGGGLYLYYSDATLRGNTVQGNTTGTAQQGYGGGLCLKSSDATLQSNTVRGNTTGTAQEGYGGGLYLEESNTRLDNNIIADNQASTNGAGLYVTGSSSHLRHTTIARNTGGDGSGVYATRYDMKSSTVALTNTILTSHTVGIVVIGSNTAILESILWHSNGADISGVGITVNNAITGDPAFVGGGDYHLNADSAAVDAGVEAGLTTDIDGDIRPADFGYDLGADERIGPCLALKKQAWQPVLRVGDTLTYTILVTSIGSEDVPNVILDDPLPPSQQPLAIATDRGVCNLGVGWGGLVTCNLGDMAVGSTAQVTLTVGVTTTRPGPLPYSMRNTVQVQGDNAANEAFEDVLMQDCYVRINGHPPEYATVQAAVDAAREGDTLQVAGLCASVHQRAGLRQVVYLDKSLTLRGGYTTTNWTDPNPAANPTTLDARGQGRVAYITGEIDPTLEGLRLTGGDATGLGGTPYEWIQAGGGVYVYTATATIRDCVIYNNVANTTDYYSWGGGLYLRQSEAALLGNRVQGNTASVASSGSGGGVYLYESPATLENNTIINNIASTGDDKQEGGGGGLCLVHSDATLQGNTIINNIASTGYQSWGQGGGLSLGDSDALLQGNLVEGNIASTNWSGEGGGLYLWGSNATLEGNRIIGNNAGTVGWSYGGGLFLDRSNDTLSNNLIADNQISASGQGAGVYVEAFAPRLLHNTIARNHGGDGSGVYVTLFDNDMVIYRSNVALTNTILVSHTVGIAVTYHNSATLKATLWDNDTDWTGNGILITDGPNWWGDPDFLAPLAGDYHIGPNSMALDRGIAAGVETDIDGDPRPLGPGYDLGMDEAPTASPARPILLAPPDGTLTTTQALTLAWQAGSGSPPTGYNLALDGKTITTTGTSSATVLALGTHTWSVRAYNPIGYSDWAGPWTLMVTDRFPCEQVTGVALRRVTPGTIYAGDLVQFSADLTPDDFDAPYTYTVSVDGQTAVQPTSASADPLAFAHTFPYTGTYSVAVAVWNCGMTETITGTVQVNVYEPGTCIPVEGVELSLLTPAPLYAGDTAQFSADLASKDLTLPYTYTLYLDDMTLAYPQAGETDPLVFSHTFPHTGTYAVEIQIWNCGMTATEAVSDRLSLEIKPGYRIYLPLVLRGSRP